ncbi:hypothetical protein F4861DRAFT_328760 [Xylaria intraflava]|nr:hypothetical protein F4861DRAFT_328760 [Xylaria intraflava]
MYWYFRFYIDETKKIDLLFRSLLRQLGSKCRRFPDDTLNWLRSYRDSGKSMKTDQLFKNLSGFISKADKDIFIVLDGLDEFPEDSKEAKRSQLLDHITALASAGHPNLHIALISKDEKDIRHELENKLKDILVPVNINKKLNEDLDNFITRKMNGMSLLTPSLKQDIQKKLEKGDDRNFLYATSLFNEVADCQNGIEIRDAIERVPGSMAAIYQKALETVREERAGSMKLILIWLMRQLRPLTRNEIAAAVGLAEPAMVTRICTKALVEPCSQVVSVAGRHRSLEVLRFTHSSAKDYLETVLLQFPKPRDDGIGRFVFSDEDVNLQMTQRCLKILVSCSSDHTFDDDAKSETQVGLPLLQYAAEYWFLHYNLINRKKLSSIDLEALEHDVYSLFKPGNHTFAFWLNIYNPDYLPPTFQTLFDPIDRKLAESVEDEEVVFPSPVYYAVKLGLPNIALGLIEQNEDAEMLNRSGSEGTTLQLVARRGHYKILDALLKRGVPVNSPAGRHGTALYAASTRGDKAFVKRLLDSGATSNGSEDGILGSPLHVAAFYGNVSVIDQLLEPGHLQVDHLAGPFGTALQAASAGKRIDAVDLLLKHHANPNIVGGCLGTAIQAALSASEGYAGEAHTIVDTLKNAQAQYREDYVFWTTAYNRVRLQFSLEQAGVISGIRGGAAPFELEWPQSLFASSLCTWNLPSISELVEVNNFLPQHSYWHKIPWCLQLKEILRAAPRLETNAEELSRKDFRHRALFWSGMNRIFEYLSPLLRYTYRSLVFGFQPSEDSHLLAFKWIHVDRDTLNPGVLNPLYEQYLELSGRYSRHYPSFRYLSRNPYMTAMDRSDRIEADLTKYTERFDLDATDRGLIDKLDSLEQMVLVINSLLPLIRDLLQYTDRCSRYHAEAIERTDSISNNTVEIIEDLTYELFSAVLRLWICVDQTQPSMVGFFRTIKLLSTIRLERIRELDAKCEKLLTQELLAGIKGREERYEEMTREALEQIQSTVVDQVADLKAGIATQLSEWQPSLTQEIETLVSAAVKSEVSQALGKVQDELRSQIRDEVREELLGAQARSA